MWLWQRPPAGHSRIDFARSIGAAPVAGHPPVGGVIEHSGKGSIVLGRSKLHGTRSRTPSPAEPQDFQRSVTGLHELLQRGGRPRADLRVPRGRGFEELGQLS